MTRHSYLEWIYDVAHSVWMGVGVFIVSFLIAASTQAQSSAISISPLTFELTANPGDKFTNIVKVYNNGDTPVNVTMEVHDFAPTGEEGKVTLATDEDYSYSLTKWVTVNQETFQIEPQSFRPVEFTVTLPPNAEPGGHYGTVLASVSGVTEGTGAAISQKIGSLLLLQVAGTAKESLSIASMEAPEFSEYGPVIIASRFQNNGTVHLKPRGFILVQNMFGQETAKLNLDQKNVLPNSVRRIESTLDRKWLWGKYTATLTAIYGSTNEPLSYTVSFLVIPWRVSLAVGIASLIVLIILYRARRRIFLALKILLKGEHDGRM